MGGKKSKGFHKYKKGGGGVTILRKFFSKFLFFLNDGFPYLLCTDAFPGSVDPSCLHRMLSWTSQKALSNVFALAAIEALVLQYPDGPGRLNGCSGGPELSQVAQS